MYTTLWTFLSHHYISVTDNFKMFLDCFYFSTLLIPFLLIKVQSFLVFSFAYFLQPFALSNDMRCYVYCDGHKANMFVTSWISKLEWSIIYILRKSTRTVAKVLSMDFPYNKVVLESITSYLTGTGSIPRRCSFSILSKEITKLTGALATNKK